MNSLSIRISNDEMDGLKRYCSKTGRTQSEIIRTYIRQIGKKVEILDAHSIDPTLLPCLYYWQKAELPRVRCVYFVLSILDEVLYVGKSDDLKKRWTSHTCKEDCEVQEGGVRIAWFENPRTGIDRYEMNCMKRFKPAWNKRKA